MVSCFIKDEDFFIVTFSATVKDKNDDSAIVENQVASLSTFIVDAERERERERERAINEPCHS